MPLLLALPLAVLLMLALCALLLPFALALRYRRGRMRQRVQPWVVTGNAWLLVASAGLFLLGAWTSGHWIDHALRDGALGLAAGGLLGMFGLALARFDWTPRGLYCTPAAWLVLALTVLVAARIAWGLVLAWQRWQGAGPASGAWSGAAGLFAAAGVLLGYALAWTLGLKRRLGSPRPAS